MNERISKYTWNAPDSPTTFTSGQAADAEPALPGWNIPVNRIFK